VPDFDLLKTSQVLEPSAGIKEKVVRIYGGHYTNSGSCSPNTVESPRSGRQHEAWGGAQRNPRNSVQENL
jgi:hypothetical protein